MVMGGLSCLENENGVGKLLCEVSGSNEKKSWTLIRKDTFFHTSPLRKKRKGDLLKRTACMTVSSGTMITPEVGLQPRNGPPRVK